LFISKVVLVETRLLEECGEEALSQILTRVSRHQTFPCPGLFHV